MPKKPTDDDRWKVPRTISYTNLSPRPAFLPRPMSPALNILAVHATEARLAASVPAPIDVAIWRCVAGWSDEEAVGVVHGLWKADPPKTIADRLLYARVLQAVHDPEQRAPTADDILSELADEVPLGQPHHFTIAVGRLVTQVFRMGGDPMESVARLRRSIGAAAPLERAAFELIAAYVLRQSKRTEGWRAVERAYDLFKKLKDPFGLAQCALVAYQLEGAGDGDPAALRAFANHAVYRNQQANRFEAASRIVQYAIIAMLADRRAAGAAELDVELARAADLADNARSWDALFLTLRLAQRLKRPVRLVEGRWTFGPAGRS